MKETLDTALEILSEHVLRWSEAELMAFRFVNINVLELFGMMGDRLKGKAV